MILPIVPFGDPILRKETEEIDENYPELKKLVADMYETMYEAYGVGLAAPQIGKSIRLFVVDGSPFAQDNKNKEEAKMLKGFKKVFINPIIEEESGEEWSFIEGCLSIPNLREDVYRKENLIITYFDENFNFHEEKYDGLAARVIQHEYDHLEGVLFTDHLSVLKKRMLKGKLTDITRGNIDVDYKMKYPTKKRK